MRDTISRASLPGKMDAMPYASYLLGSLDTQSVVTHLANNSPLYHPEFRVVGIHDLGIASL